MTSRSGGRIRVDVGPRLARLRSHIMCGCGRVFPHKRCLFWRVLASFAGLLKYPLLGQDNQSLCSWHFNSEKRMKNTALRQPTKRKDAEIIVKRNFGISSLFSESGLGLYAGIAIFANRRGYRFLSDYFRWLAERPIARGDLDPGDHVHLTPHSDYCDELDFTFDTLTPSNRTTVLRNARASKRSRRRGTPIKQFTRLVTEMIETLNKFLRNDDEFRQSSIDEIKELIAVLEEKRSQLESM